MEKYRKWYKNRKREYPRIPQEKLHHIPADEILINFHLSVPNNRITFPFLPADKFAINKLRSVDLAPSPIPPPPMNGP